MRRAVFCLLLAACPAADPVAFDAAPEIDAVATGSPCDPPVSTVEDVSGCAHLATDYEPRVAGSTGDAWAACISDDNLYHQINASVSSIARVAAFEVIGDLLWTNDTVPTPRDFLQARVAYEDEQGLSSRMARRYDVHYPAPASGGCEDAAVAAANPDYCVGPARLQPAILAALEGGAGGAAPVENAARVEANLVWFLYVSVIKEATTCAAAPADCDSSWAYLTGGTTRTMPLGLGRLIDGLGAETFDRAFDGVLAVRCWKSLDNETGTSTDLATRDLAIAQLDRALLRGVALIVRQRFLELDCSSGDFQAAALARLRVLVPLLDRETRLRDAAAADLLLGEIAGSPETIDVAAAVAALDDVYPCP